MSGLQPTDPPSTTLNARGATVAITDEGPPDGPVLLMLPGVPGGHRDYRYLAPLIAAAGVRCIRIELPMYGSNTDVPPHHDYSSVGRAHLVVGTADALDIPKFSVLGHSLGGSAVLAAAALYPERVQTLTLLASTGVSQHKGIPAAPPIVRAVMTTARLPILWPRAVNAIRKAYKQFRFQGVDAMSPDEIWVHARTVWSQSFAENGRHAAKVTCPSLVAFCDDDAMIEPAIGLELAEALWSGPRIMQFESGGHALQKTRADQLGPAVAELVLGD